MRRLTVLTVLFILIGSAAAAEGFGSYLFEGEEEPGEQPYFLLNGEASVQVTDGTVVFSPSLTLNLTHPNYTEANVTQLRVILYRKGKVVRNTSIGTTVIPQYQRRTVSGTVPIPPANTVDSMRVHVGFLAAPEDRPRESIVVWRTASGTYGFEQFTADQALGAVTTNASTAYRGDPIHIQGTIENAETVIVDGSGLQVSDGSFSGRVTVPTTADTGRQNISVPVLTAAGNRYNTTVALRVRNSPPTVDVTVPAKVAQGDNVTVTVEADDDTGVGSIALTFQGETYTNRSGVFHLPTTDLAKQSYSLDVTVTDEEGTTVVASRSFEIVSQQEKNRHERSQETDGEDSGKDRQGSQSSSIPVIGAFRDLVMGLILSLLGGG